MDSMQFSYRHPATGEMVKVEVSRQDVRVHMEEFLYEQLGKQICHCQPIGDTNVVECNCQETIEEFELLLDEPDVLSLAHHQGGHGHV